VVVCDRGGGGKDEEMEYPFPGFFSESDPQTSTEDARHEIHLADTEMLDELHARLKDSCQSR
jgi:hypothetical protein